MAYPKSVWFIICNEFCERFSYYGLRTVLVLYLTSILRYDEDESTIIYHMIVFLAYFSPLFGAILSDSYLGKFKTILYLSVVYAIGNLVVTGASLADSFSLNNQRYLALLGLVLIAIGTGGIKPCVSSFGGDQFDLPAQEVYLQKFFSIFYFSINAGSLISTAVTPELRKGVQCFGRNTCFPLAFGLPAVLMVVSILVFISGKSLYKIKKPESNVIVTSCACIYHALKKKLVISSNTKKNHWLNYADDKFSEKQISDIRAALDIIYLFTPFPFFWALYDQQGSRWTLQGTLMNGRIDFLNWTMKPDQMQVINPMLVLLFIPLFETVVYPTLAKIGIRKPLQKISLGGFIAALAFVLSAAVQNRIIGETIQIPAGEGQLRVFNGFDCDVIINSTQLSAHNLGSLKTLEIQYAPVSNETSFPVSFTIDPLCQTKLSKSDLTSTVSVVEGKAVSYFLTQRNGILELKRIGRVDDLVKPKNGNPVLRILNSDDLSNEVVTFRDAESNSTTVKISLQFSKTSNTLPIGIYRAYLGNDFLAELIFFPASVNTLVLQRNSGKVDTYLVTPEKGSYIHIAWQLPQIVVMTTAEIMFSITTLEFAFTQAPQSMKSLLAAVNMLTVAFGNLIVVIVSEVRFFENQTYEYLLFAGLMVLDMIVFILISFKYKYKNYTDTGSDATVSHGGGGQETKQN